MQKIRIKIKAFDHKIIDEVCRLIIETAHNTGAIVAGPIPLPTRTEKFTVNKSTFVHKNSREQFEIRTHKRLIDINQTTHATVDSLTNLTIPAGVDIEIKMLAGTEKEIYTKEPKEVKETKTKKVSKPAKKAPTKSPAKKKPKKKE